MIYSNQKNNFLSIMVALLSVIFVFIMVCIINKPIEGHALFKRKIEPIPVEVKIETVELPIIAEDTRPTQEEQIAEAKRIQAEQMDVYDPYEISLMAKVVHAEAGNQDNVGKRLIADVIMNRIDSPLFPNTVEEVVEQKNQFAIYEWYTIDDLNAVTDEIVDRTDKEILFFKTGSYHNIGEPAYRYGDHYFSTIGD